MRKIKEIDRGEQKKSPKKNTVFGLIFVAIFMLIWGILTKDKIDKIKGADDDHPYKYSESQGTTINKGNRGRR